MNLLLAAIMFVESGNDPNAVGDHGLAVGAYQIHAAYFYDGAEQIFIEKGFSRKRAKELALGMSWAPSCRRSDFAGRVVAAYLRRYAGDAVRRHDWRTLAMVHHGGPRALTNPTPADQAYADRVLTRMHPAPSL
jgi:hypothetical protein